MTREYRFDLVVHGCNCRLLKVTCDTGIVSIYVHDSSKIDQEINVPVEEWYDFTESSPQYCIYLSDVHAKELCFEGELFIDANLQENYHDKLLQYDETVKLLAQEIQQLQKQCDQLISEKDQTENSYKKKIHILENAVESLRR